MNILITDAEIYPEARRRVIRDFEMTREYHAKVEETAKWMREEAEKFKRAKEVASILGNLVLDTRRTMSDGYLPKIQTIKALRLLVSGLGLKEAKEIVDLVL